MLVVVLGAGVLWTASIPQSGDKRRDTTESGAPAADPPPGDTGLGPARDYGDIARWHLFGAPARVAEAVAAAPEQPEDWDLLPVSDARISLSGVVYSTERTATAAIIAGPDKKDVPYSIGDTLPGGARLMRIEPTRVVIRRNGRHEEIPLPRPGSGGTNTGDGLSGSGNTPDSRVRTKRPLAGVAPAP